MASVGTAMGVCGSLTDPIEMTYLLPLLHAVQRAAATVRACGAASAAHQMPYPSPTLQMCMRIWLDDPTWR
jgi:hypothetical protein